MDKARGQSRAAKRRQKRKNKSSSAGGTEGRAADAPGHAEKRRKAAPDAEAPLAQRAEPVSPPPPAPSRPRPAARGDSNSDGDGEAIVLPHRGAAEEEHIGASLLEYYDLEAAGDSADDGAGDGRSGGESSDEDALAVPASGISAGGPDATSSMAPGDRAERLLQWLLGSAMPAEEFWARRWERWPLLVRRQRPSYYSALLPALSSEESVRALVNQSYMHYGKDLDVTHYEGGRRVTLNPGGRNPPPDAPLKQVDPVRVWKHFGEGCSVRLRCPQQHDDACWRVLSTLEEAFGSMVGANVYVTPAGSQGFAPHFDDIEAFILQLSGQKRWRVYQPDGGAAGAKALPRVSSEDFSAQEADAMDLVLDEVLSAGDLLYFPRGFVHQAEAFGSETSIHLTVSAGQRNAFVDFLEFALPEALGAAAAAPTRGGHQLRSGLPRTLLGDHGVVHSEAPQGARAAAGWESRRAQFKAALRTCVAEVAAQLESMVDAAVDQFGLNFLSDRLPPPLPPAVAARSAAEDPGAPLTPLTLLRMVRPSAARLTVEHGKVVLYHCMDNARTYRGAPVQTLEFEQDDGMAIEALLKAWPEPVSVNALPHPPAEDMSDKLGVAEALYKEGLLEIVGEESPYSKLQPPAVAGGPRGGAALAAGAGGGGDDGNDDDDDDDDDDAPF